MKALLIMLLMFVFASCSKKGRAEETAFTSNDSIMLLKMIKEREAAMSQKNIAAITSQFDSSATFINGGGFYYEGLEEIKEFHSQMFNMDSVKYTFKAGNILIDPVKDNVALVYYPWQQDWTMKYIELDTLHETGLMTIIAVKKGKGWKWQSMTNQRTKEFFPDLKTHKAKIR